LTYRSALEKRSLQPIEPDGFRVITHELRPEDLVFDD
jgi:hypothetical protein